jgi:uncharacterized integral membrane protein
MPLWRLFFLSVIDVQYYHEYWIGIAMDIKLIVILMLAGLVVLFIIQNVAVVEIRFLFWSIQMSRSLLMFLLLAIGMIIGWFLRDHLKYRKARG